ncbi:hypothetical protein D3C72_1800150 [compost metagenome]
MQFRQLLARDALDIADDTALRRIVGRRFLHQGKALIDQPQGAQVRLQVGHVAGKQIAPLPDLGILQRRIEQAELAQRLGRAVHGLDRLLTGICRAHIDEGDNQRSQRGRHEPGQ